MKYKGTDVSVYMATTAAALSTNSAVGNIQSISWALDQGITQEPSGLGSRAVVNKEGVIKISGNIKRDYDETVIDTASGNTFAEEAGAFETTALTRNFMRVIINASGLKYTFVNVIGKWTPNVPSVDGIVQETYDFYADGVYTT